MSKLVLAFRIGHTFRQIHVGEGYTFDYANLFTVFVKDKSNKQVKISLVREQPFPMVKEGDPDYIEGFKSTSDVESCKSAVPKGTTVAVIEGNVLQNATVFYDNRGVTTVLDAGNTRLIGDQSSISVGDNNVQVNHFD